MLQIINRNRRYIFVFIFVLFSFVWGCKKFVAVSPPPNQVLSTNVFSSDATANSAVAGIYSNMMTSFGFASGNNYSMTLLSGLSSDELVDYSGYADQTAFYTNTLTPSNGPITQYFWTEPFQYIYTANAIIEGLNSNTTVTDSVKQQLVGESYFVRAFCYFYLASLFNDVPLILTTNYQENTSVTRTSSQIVLQQVISDLNKAANMLSSDYSLSKGEKIRPNKWTADALLSRTYLYMHNYDSAAIVSSSIINSGIYQLETDLDNVFLANSNEAIWQLRPVQPGYDTYEAYNFILASAPYNVAMSDSLRLAFESGDLRYAHWVGNYSDGTNTWYFPYKYKDLGSGGSLSEYSMVFRLAEQYLIRAEAEANGASGGLNNSIADINIIRARAGLTPYSGSTDQASLVNVILHERQVELFTEWGHRWLDLKRLQKSDLVLGPDKGPSWHSYDTLYPIPSVEIKNNNKITQNPGY